MADIKQAAKWMNAGHKAKRATWTHDSVIGMSGPMDHCVDLFYRDGKKKVQEPFVLMTQDILADDWELA